MDILNAIVGIIQLVIAIIMAVVALYIGFSVLGKITKGIDEEKEIAKGNTAVGILVASVFIAIGIVVQSGVAGISRGISLALNVFTTDPTWAITILVIAVLQLVLGIVLAIVAIYLALNILDKLTKGIDEFAELKKGNVAVALEMAGVIITTAVIIQSGVQGITAALI
jgi:uncharacterized membrane protein YjfL (UPF0719 family)